MPEVVERFDAVVLGAGAAGLMCAIEAGNRGKRVALLEHAERVGKKILISGGGRCNFTNIHCKPDRFLSGNPHFAKSALARYTPDDFIALVKKHHIAYHEKTLGQLFCDGSATQVVDMLLAECEAAGVKIFRKAKVLSVSHSDEFLIETDTQRFRASTLVVATGGLSIPKMGATSFGYDLARQFGIEIRECYPGLVPLVLNEEDREGLCDLSGVSTEVIVSSGGKSFREMMLITHRGLSGPAILQVSSYWKNAAAVRIDLAPSKAVTADLLEPNARRDTQTLRAALRKVLPTRLADRLLQIAEPERWTNHGLGEYERQLHEWDVFPADTEGYEKAEVTAGGVDTNELSARTMESKRVPGLYFIGEVVDVTGQLGGFNFQWAWASGAAAGRAL